MTEANELLKKAKVDTRNGSQPLMPFSAVAHQFATALTTITRKSISQYDLINLLGAIDPATQFANINASNGGSTPGIKLFRTRNPNANPDSIGIGYQIGYFSDEEQMNEYTRSLDKANQSLFKDPQTARDVLKKMTAATQITLTTKGKYTANISELQKNFAEGIDIFKAMLELMKSPKEDESTT